MSPCYAALLLIWYLVSGHIEKRSDVSSVFRVRVRLPAEGEHSSILDRVAIGVYNARRPEPHDVATGRFLHWSYEPSDEHPLFVLELNLPNESRAHTSGSGVARDNCPGRCVDKVEVDAGVLRRRRDPDDLAGLGHSTVEYLIIRHDDRERSCDLTRWSWTGTLPLDR